MAISPTELEKFLDKEVDNFESYLDNELRKKTLYRGESVYIEAPSGFSSKHFNVLKKRYLAAGWTNLEYNSSQMGGDSITFKF